MQDRFTKWIKVTPLRKTTATNVTKAFTDQVIYRHGCPEKLLTDNGTQLKSSQLAKVLQAFGIQHRTTPPYTPQCNPVERANRTIKTMIAQYVGKNQKAWDEHVPALQYAFNTAWNEATGYTPAYLNHGRELARPHSEDRQHQGAAAAPETTERHLRKAHELVRIHLARAFQHQERHYKLRRRNWQPRIGELVWRKNHTLSNKINAFNAKLAPKFVGPLEVRRIISPVIVDLRDTRGRWHHHVHVQELKEHPNQTEDDQGKDRNNPDEPRAPPPNNAAVAPALAERKGRYRRDRHTTPGKSATAVNNRRYLRTPPGKVEIANSDERYMRKPRTTRGKDTLTDRDRRTDKSENNARGCPTNRDNNPRRTPAKGIKVREPENRENNRSLATMLTQAEREQLEALFGRWSSDSDLSDVPEPPPTEEQPSGTAPPPANTTRRPPPRVGTSIQRGDAETRRKILLLATPPPPPDRRRLARERTSAPRAPRATGGQAPTSRDARARPTASPTANQAPTARRLTPHGPARYSVYISLSINYLFYLYCVS